MSAKKELQQLNADVENEKDRKIQKRKEIIQGDVEEFAEVLLSYFKERKITRADFDYKVKEESFFGFFGQPFWPNHISIGISENPLEVAYKKLLDKWFFEESGLLMQVMHERMEKDSIEYKDREAGLIGSIRTASFSVQ